MEVKRVNGRFWGVKRLQEQDQDLRTVGKLILTKEAIIT
jgi:hypothetical protein